MGWLVRLASLRLTLAILLFLAASVTGAYLSLARTSPWLILSLSLLAINLLAAVATNRRFRSQAPLLLFHLALLAIVILVGVGRLTYLKGQAEVVEGEEFDGKPVWVEAGPWYPGGLEKVRFVNLGFRIAYAPGQTRLGTENRVGWIDEDGHSQEAVIGDHHALVLDHYRFYTTPNKGFALLFEWRPKKGSPVVGTVNLPSYPANSLKQAQQWPLPGMAESVWTMLQFEGELIPLNQAGEFRLPDQHTVVVRYGERRWVLPGHWEGAPPAIELPEGRLTYLGLRTWMGYQIAWDRTMPWLLAASAIAVLALAWHFWRKFASQSWNP